MLGLAAAAAVGLQAPSVAALGHLSGHAALVAALALLLNVPLLLGMKQPWRDWSRSRWGLWLGVWPFFAWAAFCLSFDVIAPLALVAAALTPATVTQSLLGAGGLAAVLAATSFSRRPRVVKRDIAIADLPPELDGYRIAQISDVHCGPLTPPARIRKWVQAVNALDADLVAVTGDLITTGDAYIAGVASALGGLVARDGVYACMGNHDYFTDATALVHALERNGLVVLRNRGRTITRSGAALHVAGVDDTWTRRDDLARALADRSDGVPTVLLAHDPDLFPAAAAAGADLVLSGHTHGGQFAIPGLGRRLNLARIVTPLTAGVYRLGTSTLYVNRGLGTTGPPVRIGASPEITVLRLRPARAARVALRGRRRRRDAAGT